MIHVGDKITLKKPMGDFKTVGAICTVYKVENGIVSFRYQYGAGGVTMDELKQYFSFDGESENPNEEKQSCEQTQPFMQGDRVVLAEDNPLLCPMQKGDCFIIDQIQYGVVILSYDGEENVEGMFNISAELLVNNFKHAPKVNNEDCECCVEIERVTDDELNRMLADSEVKVAVTFDRCATMTCKLPCGFIVASSSIACLNEEDFNEERAAALCIPSIKDNIRKLETYRRMMDAYRCATCCGAQCEDVF